MKNSLADRILERRNAAKAVESSADPYIDSPKVSLADKILARRQQSAQSMPEVAPTVGQDLSNLWNGAEKLAGQAWEGAKTAATEAYQHPEELWNSVKNVAGRGAEVLKHPGQAAAGAIPGVLSTADIPALAWNAITKSLPEYAVEKYYGTKIPEKEKSKRVPYIFEEAGTKLANKIAGEPITEAEKQSRSGGEVLSTLYNPTQLLKKAGTGLIKLPGKAATFSPEKFETFKKAGITPKLPEVADSGFLNKAEKVLENIPLSSGKLKQETAKREKHINSLFENLGNIHETKPVRQTGPITSGGAKEYNIKAKEVTGKLFDKAWEGFDKSAPVKMPNTYQAIQDSLSAISPEARLQLAESATGKELLKLEERIINSGGAIPFDDIRNVYKKDIDKGVKMWEGIADLDQGKLKKISGAMKQDMDSFVKENYPQSKTALDKANKHYKLFSDRNKKIANAAIKEKDPIKTFNNMMSDFKGGDVDAPKVIMQRMKPKDKRTFSEIFNSELGRGSGGSFEINKWATEINKMRPESLDLALSGYPKAQAQQIKDIAKSVPLMEGGKSVDIPAGWAYIFGLGTKLDPVVAGTVVGSSRILTELFTNPKVTEAMYAASKARTPLELNKAIAKYSVLPKIKIINENAEEYDKKSPAFKKMMNTNFSQEELKAMED